MVFDWPLPRIRRDHIREQRQGTQVHLWDVSSGHQLYSFAAHTNAVYAVAFGADGRTLATGGGDNTARIWTAYPWRLDDYQSSTEVSSTRNESQVTSLPARIKRYPRQYWRLPPPITKLPASRNKPQLDALFTIRLVICACPHRGARLDHCWPSPHGQRRPVQTRLISLISTMSP